MDYMEIKFINNNCIIAPLSPRLGERESYRLSDEIQKNSMFQIGLDLSYVKDCTFDFINMLSNFEDISLFNIPSDIFSILIIMDLDKSLNIFTSELDFAENKNRLINRKLALVA